MKKIALILLVMSGIGLTKSHAQGGLWDPMLTMYGFQPLHINPAYTGNMDSKWRMGAVYREQGYTVSRPYRVASGSFDINLPINLWGGNIWGIGLHVINDDQGDGALRNTRINGSFALGQYLDPRQRHSVSVGFQGGMGRRSIDYSEAYWDRQWVGEGFDITAPTGEPLIEDARGYFDMSTGVQYTYYSGELIEFYGGVSSYHVNRPDVGLYADSAETRLERRNNIHAQFVHRVRDGSMFAIKPSMLYSRQARRGNIMVGSDFQFLFSEGSRTTGRRSESSMSMGIFARVATPQLGSVTDILGTISFEFAGFNFGAGYDIPLGSFNTVNGFEGAFEFMIAYRAGYRRGLYNKYAPKRKGKL